LKSNLFPARLHHFFFADGGLIGMPKFRRKQWQSPFKNVRNFPPVLDWWLKAIFLLLENF